MSLLAGLLALGLAPVGTDAVTLPVITAVTAGYGHSCALTSAGGVKCWGYNGYGQLGDGTPANRSRPVDVAGLRSGVLAIAASYGSTCALTSGGAVKCWGYNGYGQLGNGTTINRATPVAVLGLGSRVVAIAAHNLHACALLNDGVVKCWGFNYAGQLGNGTTTDSSLPVAVVGLAPGVTSLALGSYHSCALARGAVQCWGANSYGKLGNGSTVKSPIPASVVGLTSGVIAIAAGGYHTCAVTRAGAVECWGYNGAGRLGNGSTTTSSVPVAVPALPSGVSAIAAGEAHTCAVASGAVKCWGYGGYGQLGNGRMFNSKAPVDVDFATYQTIALRGSRPQGPIAPGTAITFTADVRPLLPTGVGATVRFEIFRDDGDGTHLAARRDVVANASGRAVLRWTFVTSGQRHVRAKALANVQNAASPWTGWLGYYVSSEQ